MKLWRIFLPIILLSNLCLAQSAHAVEPLQGVLDCSTNPNGACIEAIYINTKDGKHVQAHLTGQLSHEVRKYSDSSILDTNWQTYNADGISFQGTKFGSFMPRIFYFPFGNQDCFYGPCFTGEYLEVTAMPVMGPNSPSPEKIHLPFRSTDLSCGVRDNPQQCWKSMDFGSEFEFEFHLRLPEDFTGISINGRGLKNLSNAQSSTPEVIMGKKYVSSVVKFTPIPFEGYGFAGAAADPYGDGATDNFSFWVDGSRSPNLENYGKCISVPAISTVGNVMWMGSPTWNSQTQSVDVFLRAPHFRYDGSLNEGYIEAKISKALANCLWQVDITKAVQAKISLTYDSNGQVQTQSSSGQLVGDEYVLTVSGIHFSNPTLSFALTQTVEAKAAPESVVPQIQASTKPVVPVNKTKSILCISGKKKLSITGAKPTCPKGYKPKS